MTIAFTPGEPSAIGIDIAVLNTQKKNPISLVAFCDPDVLMARAKMLNTPIKIIPHYKISNPGEISVYPIKVKTKVFAGEINYKNSAYIIETLDIAIKKCLTKEYLALLTGPVHKGVINQAGINFTGHTEYLAKKTGSPQPVMVLACDKLKVALITTHLPLNKVCSNISKGSIIKIISIINEGLKKYFKISNPNITVCGLNPHAGEQGFLGKEEINIITPALNILKKKGLKISGPISADTAFIKPMLGKTDIFVGMYHDQILPVIKTLCFQKSANITLGLPFLRVSIDHGTALDLVGSKKIKLGSFYTAINFIKQFYGNTQ